MSWINGHIFPFSVQLIVGYRVVRFQTDTLMVAVVMILRVWAMYNRSTLILGVLLTSFSLEIIANILFAAVTSIRTNLSGTLMLAKQMVPCTNKLSIMTPLICRPTVAITHIPGYSFCMVQPTPPIWTQVADILQITHGAAVCSLGIVQFVIQSLQMYPRDKAVATQPVHGLARQRGHPLFLCVCPFPLCFYSNSQTYQLR